MSWTLQTCALDSARTPSRRSSPSSGSIIAYGPWVRGAQRPRSSFLSSLCPVVEHHRMLRFREEEPALDQNAERCEDGGGDGTQRYQSNRQEQSCEG